MKFNLGISNKIVLGYIIILLITTVTSGISILQLEANKHKFLEISNVYLPSITYLKEFEALSQESNNLIGEWIRVANKDEKERLVAIHNKDYPTLKSKIEAFVETSANPDLQSNVTKVLIEFDATIGLQKKIMKNLETPENNMNDSLVDASIAILENEIKPRFNNNQLYLKSVLASEVKFLSKLEHDLDSSYNYLDLLMVLILLIIILVGLYASFHATRSITMPIINLKETIGKLGRGEVPTIVIAPREDEIGEMALAIKAMIESIKLKTEFAAQTGNGNYTADFKFLSERDVLGLALVQMRNNLKRTAEQDTERNWINIGLAKASELLSLSNEGADNFYSNIIIFLSEYLGASLGGLYIYNEEEKANSFLELKAAYAFDKDKISHNRVGLNEGLIGQAAVEKKILFLKDIPEGYINIRSGLGSTAPKHIIIAPLVFEDELKGVIELATIEEFSNLQIEFLETTAKNIAIAFDLKARKSKTELLLNESRKLNEQLELSQAKLTTANRELKTFVYKASHDLKGPLSTMLGLINLALMEEEEKVDKSYIQMISETANKLDKILLVLIKIMSIRDAEVKKEAINFREIIDDTILKLKDEVNLPKVKIFKNISTKKVFISDKEILGYVLQNVLENSIKYQQTNKADGLVTVEVTDTQSGIKLNISDNGVGIKENIKHKVFEMFFRGNSNSSGSGLGLYFVRNSINKLGGKIEFLSEEGIGTIVTIYLPNLMA